MAVAAILPLAPTLYTKFIHIYINLIGNFISCYLFCTTGGEAWQGETSELTFKLIVCGFYLFFGLALLAMCMDLMKEEVRANFLWLGKKVGLGGSRKKKK